RLFVVSAQILLLSVPKCVEGFARAVKSARDPKRGRRFSSSQNLPSVVKNVDSRIWRRSHHECRSTKVLHEVFPFHADCRTTKTDRIRCAASLRHCGKFARTEDHFVEEQCELLPNLVGRRYVLATVQRPLSRSQQNATSEISLRFAMQSGQSCQGY